MAGSKEGLNGLLRPFLLDGVTETSEEIGKGVYGTVCKVRWRGMIFAAKKLHGFPQLSVADAASRSLAANLAKECELLVRVRHPYVVQLMGVYQDSGRPALVLEYLPFNLAKCLEDHPQIPRFLQISILHNIALALTYLHGHSPPLFHGNLRASNILLTANMVAKITDLGIARLLGLSSLLKPPTKPPPHLPPEALSSTPTYGTKVDTFSFGVLIVHLVAQTCPVPERPAAGGSTPSEAERRQKYLEMMGMDHFLLPLVLQCLQNEPHLRPEATDITSNLEVHQRKYPVPTATYLDLLHVLEISRNQLEAKGVQLESHKEQIQTFSLEVMDKNREIASLKEKVGELEKQLASSLKEMLLQNESERATASALSSKGSSPASLLQTQNTFTWKRDANMPVGMHSAHGLLLDDKLYLGGGDTRDPMTDRVVYEYDVNGVVRKWTPLPPAPVAYFAMAEVNKSLTLIGGLDVSKKCATNQLVVWNRDDQRWITPYPSMPTPRQEATAATYQLWLLVAGGMNFKKPVHNVELLDCATFHWRVIQPLPRPSVGMTSCVVNRVWYLLGGVNFTDSSRGETGPQESVFALPLTESVASNKWNVLPDTPLYCSTAVAFGDYLMSVGGTNSLSSRNHSAAMFLYSPATEKWLFVGNMPTPRCRATCIVLSKGRLIVLGGQERSGKQGATVELLYC